MAKLMSSTMLRSCEDLFQAIDKSMFSEKSYRMINS